MYRVIFSRRAEKAFLSLSDKDATRIKDAVEKLKKDPRAYGTIKLENAPVASYRYRVGEERILFDINDEARVIEILDIRKRDERTYK
ncbi:MAG: type II toxin-antitoxin system RelE/ParE family toxin [Syntrophomonadaceae bacterium]|nr:type II toxin-antitoxin system RelE/ParE family toxin [Syntrophomonadaceae bacterium]